MLAEWITRGAGDRDSRELLAALDNLGVSHGESAQTLHTSIAAATLGRNLIPALEIFADVVLRPHLDDDEVEPIRALALQNLRSLEDDPGTKVIYELRKRHFPDPWGRPVARDARGGRGPVARRPAARSTARATGPTARSSASPARSTGRRCATPSAALFGDWEPRPDAERPGTAHRPEPRPHPPRDPADPDRAGLSRRRPSPAPTTTAPGPPTAHPRRLLVGPALHRGPREARALLLGLRQLREPARPRGRPLLRRHLDRPGAGDPRRHPRRDRPPRPRRASRPRSSRRCGRA